MNGLNLLSKKRALVTGAARGIGFAIAKTFASNGATVFMVDELDSINESVSELQSLDLNVVGFQCDITDDNRLREIVKEVRKDGIDVLVNNAGVLQQGLIGMSSMQTTQRMFEVNIIALINLSQYLVRVTPQGKPLSIINLASIAGTLGMEGVASYSASKGAVVAYTLSAAKELARRGVRMNALAPGFIDTDMTREVSTDLHQQLLESVRLGRIGHPQDVANAALFLASDLSSYITGQVIGVDGAMGV